MKSTASEPGLSLLNDNSFIMRSGSRCLYAKLKKDCKSPVCGACFYSKLGCFAIQNLLEVITTT